MSIVNIREVRDTQAEAEARREEIMYNYHPAGYGTTLRVAVEAATGRWLVEGYRYSSCD